MGRPALVFASVLLTLCCLPSGEVLAQSFKDRPTSRPAVVSGQDVGHWTRLPLLGDEARDHGFELPLPLGISGNLYKEKQDFEVVDLKVGLFGHTSAEIDKLIAVGDARTEQIVWNTRFDTWILPFLNLYGILGYADGGVDVGLGPLGIPIYDLSLKYSGPTLGGGGTLAGGFRPFEGRSTIVFGQADLNFTKTFLCFDKLGVSPDAGIDTLVFCSRLGVRERVGRNASLGDLYVSLWGGAMYQNVQSIIPGRAEALGLDFCVEQQARDPWNAIFGGRFEVGKNLDFVVEVGVGGRQSLMLGATFRF
ncbi:MAG: hypothetical protein JXQ73_21945 [Phycisphaerae bacterium]|nr:hypothetical protein [Phycisphaerae bacterium]